MSKDWSPYDEAEYKLPEYEHFFQREKVVSIFGGHPQVFEDWLVENCPRNYCYVWVWNRKDKIVDDLIAVPKDIALAITLITGIDFVSKSNFHIKNEGWHDKKKYRLMEKKEF